MRLPFRRKPTRLERIRAALERFIPDFDDDDEEEEEDDDGDTEEDVPLGGLHWMAAALFVAAGAETALGERRGDHRGPDAIRWAPLIAAPVAGAAHAARAIWPSQTTRTATDIANGLAIGVGAAGLASSLYSAFSEPRAEGADWDERLPSLAPLAFAAIGVLGLLLDREEEDIVEIRAALERRARIVERLVPKRKPRFDHVVVHV